MEETGDEPLFCERAAGIGIGKQAVMVTIRIPSGTRRGGRQQETREFADAAGDPASGRRTARLPGLDEGQTIQRDPRGPAA